MGSRFSGKLGEKQVELIESYGKELKVGDYVLGFIDITKYIDRSVNLKAYTKSDWKINYEYVIFKLYDNHINLCGLSGNFKLRYIQFDELYVAKLDITGFKAFMYLKNSMSNNHIECFHRDIEDNDLVLVPMVYGEHMRFKYHLILNRSVTSDDYYAWDGLQTTIIKHLRGYFHHTSLRMGCYKIKELDEIDIDYSNMLKNTHDRYLSVNNVRKEQVLEPGNVYFNVDTNKVYVYIDNNCYLGIDILSDMGLNLYYKIAQNEVSKEDFYWYIQSSLIVGEAGGLLCHNDIGLAQLINYIDISTYELDSWS